MEPAIKQGKFREDLFYRLNVFPITIPPLRERREDIPLLVWHFVTELGQKMGRQVDAIYGPTMEGFKNYSWPGNIRELRNVVERFMISHTGTTLFGDWESIETSTAPDLQRDARRHGAETHHEHLEENPLANSW